MSVTKANVLITFISYFRRCISAYVLIVNDYKYINLFIREVYKSYFILSENVKLKISQTQLLVQC